MSDDRIDGLLRDWGDQQRRAAEQPDDPIAPVPASRHRIGLLAGAAAASVVLIAAGAIALRDSGTGRADRSGAPLSSPTGLHSSASSPGPPSQQVTYHRLAVTVPASWPINDAVCGIPRGDTVLVPGPTSQCLVPRPPGITWVQLTTAGPFYQDPSYGPLRDRRVQAIEVHGLPATRTTGSLRDGDAVVYVSVPGADAGAIVYSPSRAKADAIARTLQVVDMDANGCATHAPYRALPRYPAPADPAARRSLVPGHPVSMVVCGYVGTGLVGSAEAATADLPRDLTLLGSLPPGYSIDPTVTPRRDTCSTFADPAAALDPDGPVWYTVLVGYEHAPTLVLHARVGICGYLGLTNGAFAAQRGSGTALIEFLEIAHAGAEYRTHVVPAPN